MNKNLLYLDEPQLMFGYNQKTIDPRDGLILFGPHEPLTPFSVKAGIVATGEGLKLYRQFVETINKPIFSTKNVYGIIKDDEIGRPSFPGFEAIFNVKWSVEPEIFKEVDAVKIDRLLKERNKKKRTSSLVDLYLKQIIKTTKEEDVHANIWFVIVPRNLYFGCKPQSRGSDLSAATKKYIELTKQGQQCIQFPGEEDYVDQLLRFYDTSSDFHHLLKARLIQEKIAAPVQIIIESTLQFKDKYRNLEFDENIKAHLAWTQSTTVYYKLGKLPWKLSDIREGVCYLGLVFKKLNHVTTKRSACSAAQMFLRDGDGSVFRGNIGLWLSKNEKEYHLDQDAAHDLLIMALDDYWDKWNAYPKELFIHGRVRFSNEEWRGFSSAVEERKAETQLTGIVIKETRKLKLFRDVDGEESNFGVLRGLAFKIDHKEAYLFTRGFIPRLQTSSCLELPNPLHIQICRGDADIDIVLKDILALTKLNYNACIYGDGLPVTLRFSDKIGSILTATDNWKTDTRQFKYYI